MTVTASAPPTQTKPHTRHYPLDLPELPFERYEHRRLVARDILVNRIMSEYMFPSKVKPRLYDSYATYPLNFGAIKSQDQHLGADLHLLRNMLCTTSTIEPAPLDVPLKVPVLNNDRSVHRGSKRLGNRHAMGRPARWYDINVAGPRTAPATLGDEILDLVQRHYMEMDDPSLRLWMQKAQPPLRTPANPLEAASPSNNTASTPATSRPRRPKEGTRAGAVQTRKINQNTDRNLEQKKWSPTDTAHLKSLQKHAQTAQSCLLFDGGAFLPALRPPLLADPSNAVSARARIEKQLRGRAENFLVWPVTDTPLRLILAPRWEYRRRHDTLWDPNAKRVDFATGRRGRGLDRDGAWSTAKWNGDQRAGRTGRAGRRRAASEPPAGMFMTARMPRSVYKLSRKELVLPKMKLAALDRRSRRRSLSRTRIAEMFDWNTVLNGAPDKRNLGIGSAISTSTRVCGTRTPPVVKTPNPVMPKPPQQPAVTNSDITNVATVLNNIGAIYHSMAGESTENRVIKDDMSKIYNTVKAVRDGDMSIQVAETTFKDPNIRSLFRVYFVLALPVFPAKISRCANCLSTAHLTCNCPAPCGFCGAPNPAENVDMSAYAMIHNQTKAGEHDAPHLAPQCPVQRQNRCKCTPFPMYHVAAKCPVTCSRDCGNRSHPTGHFKHRNAMTCKSRCCMCGIKGHSGKECKLRTCRCGGLHLGQDCGWSPICRVQGCGRYLCGLHCIECGSRKQERVEGMEFVGGLCRACLGAEQEEAEDEVAKDEGHGQDQSSNAAGVGQAATKTNRRRQRKDKGAEKEKEKKSEDDGPWYAPLKPKPQPTEKKAHAGKLREQKKKK